MLKKKDKDALQALGIDPEALIAAITAAAEIDFPVPVGQLLTDAQLTARDQNVTTQVTTQLQSQAESTVQKTFIKEVGKKMNLTINGERVGDLVAALQAEIAKDGNTKVTQMTEQINALTKDKDTLTATIVTEKANAAKAVQRANMIGMFPANRIKVLRDQEMVDAFERDHEITDAGIKRNGKLLTDPKDHAPLTIDKVIPEYFKERSWLSEEQKQDKRSGGRGGGDKTSGGAGGSAPKSLTAAQEQWKADNPDGNIISGAFEKYLDGITKADPQFDFST